MGLTSRIGPRRPSAAPERKAVVQAALALVIQVPLGPGRVGEATRRVEVRGSGRKVGAGPARGPTAIGGQVLEGQRIMVLSGASVAQGALGPMNGTRPAVPP